MKKSLLCAALLSSLILAACNKTEEIVGDEQSSTGMEYGADSNLTTVPELKPTEQPSAEQTAPATETPAEEGGVVPQSQTEDATKSQEMMDSMKNTIQEMSGSVADTVDTIKKGADETAKDISESLESAKEKAASEAAPMKEEIDQKLEELKKNEKSDSELNL